MVLDHDKQGRVVKTFFRDATNQTTWSAQRRYSHHRGGDLRSFIDNGVGDRTTS